jgi:putative ABC transport system substrate-binding protein
MKRRHFFLGSVALLAAPLAVLAQQGKIPRIGFLISETLSGQANRNRIEALRAGLRELGYVEGKNIVIEFRSADGNYERLSELAAELVRLKVDVLVAFGSKAVLAAKGATATIPIVVPSGGDPVAMGLVSSLARPGGNITGATAFTQEITAKRLGLLKEAVPGIARVGMLINSANPASRLAFEAAFATAKSLKLEWLAFEIRSPKEFGSAFAAMTKGRVNALVVSTDTLFGASYEELANLAARQRLPAVGAKEFAELGGLIGYGADSVALYRRAAYFVDRILKGAKPADLPVERPTRFELVINLKTAKALGIKIPQALLLRADQVIE